MKLGHCPVKQKARLFPLHLQEEGGKQLEKLIKTGHLEKVKHINEDYFCVSPIVITVKNDISVKVALHSSNLNDSCIKIIPLMPNMKELLNQNSVDITRGITKELTISKIDLDYAYGHMKLPKNQPAVRI